MATMTATKVVYSRTNTSVGTGNGNRQTLVFGEPWAADDPLVREHTELFTESPTPKVRTSHGWVDIDQL